MKTAELLVSSVNITEDEYNYKGLFILSSPDKSINLDLAEMENEDKIAEIRSFFSLEDSNEDIRKAIMEKVFEKAAISSRNNEGKDYNSQTEKDSVEKAAGALDMA